MTARQFQKEFEQAARFHDVLKDIRIDSDDINYFLNEGQDTFVQTKLNNYKSKRGLKNSQRELDEIRDIIVKNNIPSKDNTLSTNEYYVWTLPDNYLFLIADKCTTSYCEKTFTSQNRLYFGENIEEARKNSHHKSHYESVLSELVQNKLYTYRDNELTFDITEVKLDYIRTYNKINVISDTTSELNDSVHRDIVQLSINIFLEAVQSGRFRTNLEKNIVTTEQIKQ